MQSVSPFCLKQNENTEVKLNKYQMPSVNNKFANKTVPLRYNPNIHNHQTSSLSSMAGKSKIHFICIIIFVLVIVLRFFILPMPTTTNSNNNNNRVLIQHAKQQQQQQKQSTFEIIDHNQGEEYRRQIVVEKKQQEQEDSSPKARNTLETKSSSNNNKNTNDNEDYLQDVPKWAKENLPHFDKETLRLQDDSNSLAKNPPTYPAATDDDEIAKKTVMDLVKRTFIAASDDDGNEKEKEKEIIFQNFIRIFDVTVEETATRHFVEKHKEDHDTKHPWCPKKKMASPRMPECFKISFDKISLENGKVIRNEENNNNNNNKLFSSHFYFKLHLVATSRIAAARGFYHILKYFLDSSVMWGNERTGYNINTQILNEYLRLPNVDGDELQRHRLFSLWEDSFLNKTLAEHIDQQQQPKQESETEFQKKLRARNWRRTSKIDLATNNNYILIHGAATPLRYDYNLCTFAYTMSWWQWPEWEREIDWMALHGINMPLALVGQEAVWLKLWTEVLFPGGQVTERDVLENHFTGAAFWPWHWMGNLRKWAGPVSKEYIEKRRQLQVKILERMKEFKMFYVLPGFAGHVPEQVGKVLADWNHEKLPRDDGLRGWGRAARDDADENNNGFGDEETNNAGLLQNAAEWINAHLRKSDVDRLKGDQQKRVQQRKVSSQIRRSSLWMGFGGKFSGVVTLHPTHPLFTKISVQYMKLVTEFYGPAHFYSADQFNEMPPPNLNSWFLSKSAAVVVEGIKRVVPHGRWVVQGWLFLHHHRIWNKEAVKAYLDGAGRGNVVVLDLASDIRELIPYHNRFYGHDYIWCLLHNFGGRRGIFGDMPMIVEKMTNALAVHKHFASKSDSTDESQKGDENFVGFGLTMEATHHNPAIYELATDLMFTDTLQFSPDVKQFKQVNSKYYNKLQKHFLSKQVRGQYMIYIRGEDPENSPVIRKLYAERAVLSQFLLKQWWKTYITYRYDLTGLNSEEYHAYRLGEGDSTTTTTTTSNNNNNNNNLNSTNSVRNVFAALSDNNGPYNHAHDCCPSFSLIPFAPQIYSSVSSYGMQSMPSELDARYHPESLFGTASWLLTKVKERYSSSDNKNNNKNNIDTPLIYDAVDFTRQTLDTVFFELHDTYQRMLRLCSTSLALYRRDETSNKIDACLFKEDIRGLATAMLTLIEDLDDVSCASSNYDLHESWLDPALKWADDENSDNNNNDKKTIRFSKKDALFNAKNLITAWGDSRGQGYPNYAARSWCGLYSRLYSKRWRALLIEDIQQLVDEGGAVDVFGTTHSARRKVAEMDWDFCVQNDEDIQKFEHEQKQQKEKSASSSSSYPQRGPTSLLKTAAKWLRFDQQQNNNLLRNLLSKEQNNRSPFAPWFSDFSSSATSTAFGEEFQLLNSNNNNNFTTSNNNADDLECKILNPQGLRDARLATEKGRMSFSQFTSSDAIKSVLTPSSASSAKIPSFELSQQTLYLVRDRGSWTAHGVATAAVCRSIKHCVGFDSYGGIYLASSPKVMLDKMCKKSDDINDNNDGESIASPIPKDRLFWVKKSKKEE